jgi:3-oxoacyl-[acyl-carrier protein] reductase
MAADRHCVDITDADAVEHALRSSDAALGGLDILVNNAGYAGATAPVEQYDRLEWCRIIDTNLNGTFHVCQRAIPRLRRNGWGRVVDIASLAGKEGTPNAAAYSAAKAGIIALTKF